MNRVLGLVTFRIYPPLMGGQKGVALFYGHLKKFAAVALALSGNNTLAESDTLPAKNILFTNKLMFLNLFCIGVLKKLVREHRTEVIIAEHSYAGWIAWLLKKQTGLPFVIHSHNLEALRFKQMHRRWWRLYGYYEKWIHQKADFNFFISNDDKTYAVTHFNLAGERCATITYGVTPFQKTSVSRSEFLKSIGLNDSFKILFFNGTLDYEPNYEAVRFLGNDVIPRLKNNVSNFRILVSGNRISQRLKAFIAAHEELIFLAYVPDVNLVYQAAQLFINPILNNTGVKTKVIEAVANHCTVVSTESGASGINKKACGSKLITVPDGDWNSFANCIAEQLSVAQQPTDSAFFATYLWDAIAEKAATEIAGIVNRHAGN